MLLSKYLTSNVFYLRIFATQNKNKICFYIFYFQNESIASNETVAAADDSVFTQAQAEDNTRDLTKSPLPGSNSTNGKEIPPDHAKPVTPDFSAITTAQVSIFFKLKKFTKCKFTCNLYNKICVIKI